MAGLVICGGGNPTLGAGVGAMAGSVSLGGPEGPCWLLAFAQSPLCRLPPPSSHPGGPGRYLQLVEAEGEVEDLGELLGQGLLPLEVLGRGVRGAGEGFQQAPQGVLWGRNAAGPRPAPALLPGPGWGN